MVISAIAPARPQTLSTAVVRVTFIFHFFENPGQWLLFEEEKELRSLFAPLVFAFDSLLPLLPLTPPPGAGSSLSPFSTPFSRT